MSVRPRVVLGLLLLAQLAATVGWIARDRFPSGFDCCEHLLFAHRIAEDLDDRGPGEWLWHNRRKWTRATGVHLALAPAMRVWPGDDDRLITALSGALSLVVLALACFAMGRALAGEEAGWHAAALVLLAPGIWGTARTFGTDLPLAAGAAALAAWLICRPPWERPREAFAAGLVAGMLCLVKAQFVFWAPWLVLAARPPARMLGLFAAGAALGSSPFWGGELLRILDVARWHAVTLNNPANDMPERFTVAGLSYYPLGLLRWCGIASVPALLVGWRYGRQRVLIAGVVGGLLVHQLVAVKFVRYVLPAIPLLAVLAAVGLQRTRWRHALIAVALIGGVACQWQGSRGALPGWTGVDGALAHAPVASDWRERARQLADALGGRRPAIEVVGLTPATAWGPDDISRMERYLIEWLPHAEVFIDAPVRHVGDPEHYARSAARLSLRVVASDPTQGAPPLPPPGWVEVFTGSLWPAALPAGGPPLRLAAWIRHR